MGGKKAAPGRESVDLGRFGSVATKHWHALSDGQVQCDVCPRACRLAEGQRGLCFVRAREQGEVVLTSWGRSSGFCVDPIEKKPLNHFLPGTPVLSFGTAGCNLTCRFCQNWDISKSREIDTLADSAPPERIAAAARALGCRSVAFTYNDPVIFLEYAIDTAVACREADVRAVAVTAGYICEQPRLELFRELDAVNVDLKSFDDAFYREICGARLGPVLETLQFIARETEVWLEITTLLIPGANDSDREIHAAAEWVARELGPSVPWHLTAFHPDYRMRDRGPTPLATLTRAREIARSYGLHFVYTGNVHDEVGDSTLCPGCELRVIGRDRYEITDWNLDDHGCCRGCGRPCEGVFEPSPGSWGRRRQPVRLAEFGGLDPADRSGEVGDPSGMDPMGQLAH